MKTMHTFKVQAEFVIQAENYWEAWEEINSSPHRPFRKVELEIIETYYLDPIKTNSGEKDEMKEFSGYIKKKDELIFDDHSQDEMLQAAKPLIKWLNERHPHHKAIVTSNNIELLEGIATGRTDEFLKD